MEAANESQTRSAGSVIRRSQSTFAVLVTWGPALLSGLFLRLWLLKKLFQVTGDSLIYGELAKNMLQGHYSRLVLNGSIVPTMIRLPGYPAFVAACFRLFGTDNYFAPVVLQTVLELLSCALLADCAARVVPPKLTSGARQATLWLGALCPFTASLDPFPLAEPLTLFSIALAIWSMVRFVDRQRWATALSFTFGVTYAAMLRPDGVLVAVAFVPALLAGAWRRNCHGEIGLKRLARMAVSCSLLAIVPFAAWTWRNWQVFHVFQPLAPRLANDPGEDPHLGWEHWVKSWCLDWKSTYEIYWYVPDDRLDVSKLPARAFDSQQQYAQTLKLSDDYNRHNHQLTPEIDARFERLARERIAANPLRYYLWLPLGRLADMWLRPRVENLNIDPDWWDYSRHHAETRFSWFYAALNLLYLGLAAVGIGLRPRFWIAMPAYILLRSALLLTVEAPETRYTIECFPMLFVLAGTALYWLSVRVCLSVFMVKASEGTD